MQRSDGSYGAMDEGKVGILLLLYLLATFDTVDQKTLLDRLREELGVDGTAPDWFQSFLTDRQQTVTIQWEESNSCWLNFGIHQGSVLGPQLFTAYAMPLGRILRAHGLSDHFSPTTGSCVFVRPNQLQLSVTIDRLSSIARTFAPE